MKISTIAFSTLFASAAAFSPNKHSTSTKTTSSRKQMSDRPIFAPPEVLDGSLPGDYKFDPFNFAKNEQDLKLYREAEVRHGRLAMLAAIGWPLAELFNKDIASEFHLPALISNNDLNPAVLNGNIGNVNPLFFVAALTLGAVVESQTLFRNYEPRMIGDVGFDPLNAYPKEPELQKKIAAAEIDNGRLAMLAVTSYAISEAVNHVGVVDATPQFF
mmetsp:Transcript_92451/g.266956  ORF Transcript_92451/g.266956 Transcript_92451/m.266956 type:complete len:216 (+) Transcript_92451:257-904(+)|eukprot:CAMPEP_0176093946 /NCGR_PEP_ID=MMETSP0120_2-20121206/47074_1 /TAXON_ID=160619 /ORGANISM="Kryptoperidinium foliaceum, Strain CCMP 1326" /LENGTH=215 /DNA_ID=CAMNT_0017427881 /DNA_START=214 /DNA_END=861 /DNA_ORIENTATION=+